MGSFERVVVNYRIAIIALLRMLSPPDLDPAPHRYGDMLCDVAAGLKYLAYVMQGGNHIKNN